MSEDIKTYTAIFPVIQNPPTFGFLLALYNIADDYEKIYIVLQKKSYVFKPEVAKNMLEVILNKYSTKFVVVIKDIDFSKDTILDNDDLPPYDYIITISKKVYANLLSKGYKNSRIIPSVKGWDETFHRLAYVRSSIYDEIKSTLNYMRQ